MTDADALAWLLDLREAHQDSGGDLQIRIFSDQLTSFHPKAYLFHHSAGTEAAGFVGSNNLSRSGIAGGVEWAIGVDEVGLLVDAFDQLWNDARSRDLDHDFLRHYRNQWKTKVHADRSSVEIDIAVEPPSDPVGPSPIQIEALAALEATRQAGHAAGLVVMATGLGKTWLAAFDSTRMVMPDSSAAGLPSETVNGLPSDPSRSGRILFVAHREEILRQSRDVFRQVVPSAELGLYTGTEKRSDADVVFASVQTVSRHLDEFSPGEFDYLVIDEFHHAAAPSYRRVVDHFTPRFLLGLTATPERMDGADLLALCGDNLVFEAGLVEGINRSELVPFHYWGISDVVDYEPIPWRSGRFDPQVLTEAVETQARAQHTLEQWREHCRDRTLSFCVSITHADFMADYFNEAGVSAVAVHSGPSSYSRTDAVEQLRQGDIQIVFTVDVFNEGVDIPEIDSVMMLRPTGSPIVFLQQLGRGLRTSDYKEHLDVVDFVGNHASFLTAPRVLANLMSTSTMSQSQAVRAIARDELVLPAGCSVNFDLELIDLFEHLLATRRTSRIDALSEYCVDVFDEAGRRPTAVQVHAGGLDPRDARRAHRGWFPMLESLGVLTDDERAVVKAYPTVLSAIETEPINKSYKLITLRALLAEDALRTGMTIDALSDRSRRLVLADPRLVLDTQSSSMPDVAETTPAKWRSFWRTNPLEHLVKSKRGGSPLFVIEGDRLLSNFQIDERLGETFDAMVGEIVDWRFADYLIGRVDA